MLLKVLKLMNKGLLSIASDEPIRKLYWRNLTKIEREKDKKINNKKKKKKSLGRCRLETQAV